MDNSILTKIEKTAEKNGLLQKGDRVLVALSGGADSVFLLNVLLMLKEKYDLCIFAAHVNHGLRGKDADSDEKFCESCCREKNVDFFVKRADVAALAAQKSVSEEVAGREVRYEFFKKLAEIHGFTKIATAHNADDNIETVLMRFIRGSGVLGLCGIPYKNGSIIRPVLDITRGEIEEFLKENNISYVTDKTNFEEIYTRNKLRLSLIPKIESELNSGFKKSLMSNISLYVECADFLLKCESDAYKRCAVKKKFHTEINVDELKSNHVYVIKSVIKRVLEELSAAVSHEAICDCLEVLEGRKKSICLSGRVNAELRYGKMFFYKDIPEDFCYIVAGGCVDIAETGAQVTFAEVEKIDKSAGKNVFFADGDKLGNLCVRSRLDGDYFYPSGKIKQRVKLKDYFINNKVPSFLRKTVPVVLSDGEIVWIAGMRSDVRFAANDETKNIVKIEISNGGY